MFERNTAMQRLAATLLCTAFAACGGGGGGGASTNATVSASDDAVTVAWNVATSVDVLANDSASQGALALTVVSVPAHGSVQISSGKLVYTPLTGYYGSDSLSYTVSAAQGGAVASATVTITVNARLQLKGIAASPKLAGANIVAKVGGSSYQTVADSAGAYTLPIESSHGADMIVLSAQGSGAQSGLKLLSLAGDFASLTDAAAANGDVPGTAAPSLNITPLSTAFSALVTSANGYQFPSSMQQLDSMAALIPLARMADWGADIKLVADDGVSLPAGVTDTWEMVSSPSASTVLSSFWIPQPTGSQFLAARAAVLSSTAPSGIPAAMTTSTRSIAYVLAYKASGPDALLVTYRPDGSATVVTSLGSREATWSVASDVLRVVLKQALSMSGFGPFNPETGIAPALQFNYTGFDFHQLRGSASAGTVLVVNRGNTVDALGQITAFDTSQGMLHKALDLSTAEPLAPSMTVNSRWAGVVAAPSVISGDASTQGDILRITGASSALLERTGTSLTWSLDNGWLKLISNDGDRRYLRIAQNAASGEEHWLAANFQGGAMSAMNEILVVKVDAANSQFTAGPALYRRWLSGLVDLALAGSQLFMDLYSDGTTGLVSLTPDGLLSSTGGTWTINAEGTVTQRRVSPTTLALIQQREWTMVRTSGAQIFVMEHLIMPSQSVDWWRLSVYVDQGASAK